MGCFPVLHSYSLTGDTLITIDIFAAQHGPQIGLELKGRHRKLWASSCLGGVFSASHYVSVCGCIITLNLKITEQRKTTQVEPGDLEGLSSPWLFNVIMAIWLYRSTKRHACLNLSLPWTQQKVLRLMFFFKSMLIIACQASCLLFSWPKRLVRFQSDMFPVRFSSWVNLRKPVKNMFNAHFITTSNKRKYKIIIYLKRKKPIY